MRRLLALEWRRVARSRALAVAVVAWSVAAVAALVNGERIVDRQRRALADADRHQAEQHAAVLSPQPASAVAGDQLYYLAYHTRHEPSPWAAVSIGQRDTRAFNLKVRILALHGQLYDGELTSPLLAALGTFDLAFVLVALAPLLAIGLCHDLVSAEREAGTWPLVRAQPGGTWRALVAKVAVRFAVLVGLLAAAVAVVPALTEVPVDGRLAMLFAVAAVYLAAWVALAIALAMGRLPSDANALVLLAVWLVWVVVGPALVTTIAASRFPAPEALALTVAQREGYHGSWDRPVGETMAAFYDRYPEWRGHPVPRDRYSNAWYYAMQQRGDDAAAPAAGRYLETLRARHAWTSQWMGWLAPAAVQSALDRLARTDLPGHLAYLDSVASYHEALKRHFFPIIFSDAPMASVDWGQAPRHRFAEEGRAADLAPALAAGLAWTAAALAAAWLARAKL
ncbi:MAG: DUF3526 domain-containing protein [Vicinamibacterales bacterium]